MNDRQAFARIDGSPDSEFYRDPRFVEHIDDGAIDAVTAIYRETFAEGALLLDLMSSWVSHLPADIRYAGVVGLGMNAAELAKNPQLTQRIVADLNEKPALPFDDGTFDGAALCVSIQYLTRPVEVLADVARVLKHDAPIAITFSNRCFPTKAVAIWQMLDANGHLQLVSEYLRQTHAFSDISASDRSPNRGDPLYSVKARALHAGSGNGRCMTQTLKELSKHNAPAGKPQPMTVHEGTLWIGCWETSRLYAVDPKTWTTLQELELPGVPYGLASFQGALHIVISVGGDDDRYLYRFVPGHGLSEDGRVACPEHTGSHLTTDGTSLYLVQQGFQRIMELAADGTAKRTIDLPTRCAGAGFNGDTFYMITADDEFDVLELAMLDLDDEKTELVKLAPMNAEARGLAFDGSTWWTALREQTEIVNFSL